MGWQDRPYSQPTGSGNWGYRLLFGDFGVGQLFGIDIRVHCSLVILIAFQLILGLMRGPQGLLMAAIGAAVLFGVILLHEFGHCFAARSVGGRGDNVLLWPLGGLAYVSTPHRPWNNFVATAGGPAVNVVICLVCAIAMKALTGIYSFPSLLAFLQPASQGMGDSGWTLVILNYIYSTSMALLLFNLLPILPLDGGSMLQSILWKFIGYYRALVASAVVGMIGAVIVGVLSAGSIFMVLLMVSCFLYCAQVKNNAGAVADARYEESRYATSGHFEYGQRGASEGLRSVSFGRPRQARPKDDRFTWRDINPLEWLAKKRRRKQFERLMRDD